MRAGHLSSFNPVSDPDPVLQTRRRKGASEGHIAGVVIGDAENLTGSWTEWFELIESWRRTSSWGIEGCTHEGGREGGKEGKKGKAMLLSATVYSGFVILAVDRRL